MTLCSECKAKVPTMRKRLVVVNGELWRLGLTYHEFLPLQVVNMILERSGFSLLIDGFLVGAEGRLHEEVGEGKWLSMTWYKMPSGRYEVVAYVS